jgi:hypothetical protein
MSNPSPFEDSVREQVRLELAVRQALEEDGGKKDPWLSRLLKHPLWLLLIGSLLTAIVGGFFTAQWQFNQWRNEQELQIQIERAKEMRQLQVETAEALADVFDGAVEVLHFWEFDFPDDSRIAPLEDRSKRWMNASRAWRRSHSVLLARVNSSFGARVGNEMRDLYQPKLVENAIGNLLSLTERRRRGKLSKQLEA